MWNSSYETKWDSRPERIRPIELSDSDLFKKRFIRFLREDISIIWIIFGTIGNMLTLLVLCKHKMRKHSTFTYLTILSLCDTLVLYFGLFRDYLVYKYKIDVDGDFLCKFHVFFFYFVLHMASWLLVAVNIDRLIAASFLGLSKKWCTPRIAIIVSLSLALVFVVINSHFIFFVNSTENSPHYYLNLSRTLISRNENISHYKLFYNSSHLLLRETTLLNGISIKKIQTPEVLGQLGHTSVNPFVYSKCLIKTDWPKYNFFFMNIFTWIDAGAQVILPFIIMVICNVNIIYKVLITKNKTNGKNSKRLRKIKGMCIMIISVSIIFFVLEMPVLIFLGLMQGKYEDSLTIDLLWTIVNLMMYTNHIINFFSYCMTGTKFRRELIQLLCFNINCIKLFPSLVNRYPGLIYSHTQKATNVSMRTSSRKKKKTISKKPYIAKDDETCYLGNVKIEETNLCEPMIVQENCSVYPNKPQEDPNKRVNFGEMNSIHIDTAVSANHSLTSLFIEKKKMLNYDSKSSMNDEEVTSRKNNDHSRREFPLKRAGSVKQLKKKSSLKRKARSNVNVHKASRSSSPKKVILV